MSQEDVRKGITNAKFNEESSNILFGEITLLSIFLGGVSESWWVLGLVFLGCTTALRFKPAVLFMCIGFSIIWGIIGYGIGMIIGGIGTSVVLGVIGLLGGIVVNMRALKKVNAIE